MPVANPILPGCFPDPSICRVGEWHYLVASTFELLPGMPVMRSRDLATWETIGHVLDRPGMVDLAGIRSSGGIFAPTIRYDGERFWIVTTLVDPADGERGGTFLVTADDAAGPWSDPIWIEVAGIDPSLLFDDDGRVWMHGTRLVAEPEWHHQTEVWVRELSIDEGRLVGDEHVVWTGAVRGAVWAEGPHLLRIDGTCYLLAAEGGTAFEHAVCIARAEHPTGPFVGSPANPVLTHRQLGHGAEVQAVGHADLVQAPDGRWWAVLLGTRPYDGHRHPLGRETFLCPVEWQDGWPVFAPGEGRVPATVELGVELTPGVWQPDSRSAGAVVPEDRRWTSVRGFAASFATPDGEGWSLRATEDGLGDPGTPAFLGVRQQHRELDVAVRVEHVADGAAAGLVIRQSEDDHVALLVEQRGAGSRVRAVHRRAGEETEVGAVDLDAGAALLGIRARGSDYRLLVDGDVVATVDARTLDTASTGGFLGVWIGIAAVGAAGAEARFGALDYRPAASPIGSAGVAA